jgi:predicted acyltransferase
MKEHATTIGELNSSRILSIDIFRGLTIFAMIFVNDLASIKKIPMWMQHMPADSDGMTFVDIVFPAFLFIVGMAIPFAINRRLEKDKSLLKLFKHIFIRTGGLLALGFYMVNIGGLNAEAAGISRSLWMLLLFIFAILVWNSYPDGNSKQRNLFISLRFLGIVGLIFLAVIYRGGSLENLTWMKTSWWGILGLIGWAYLASVVVYIIFKNNLSGIAGVLAIFILSFIGEKTGALGFLDFINQYLKLGSMLGAHASITTAGLLTTLLFFDKNITSIRTQFTRILVFAAILFIAGYLLRPLYGISKIYATPAWCLYSSVICIFIFIILYWLVDLKKFSSWAGFLKPAGSNPLLAYILPSIFYALLGIFGITFLSNYFGEGLIGIFRSIIFSLIMLAVTALLSRIHIKLHL